MEKKTSTPTPTLFNIPVITILIVLTLTIVSGFVGYLIGSRGTSAVVIDEVAPSISLAPSKQASGCTRELKICPDGTKVGRTGPYCEFESCPVKAAPNVSPTLVVSNPSAGMDGCATGGCSGQICGEASEVGNMVTTCEFKEEYTCFQFTKCERQANGKCGWSYNPKYNQCLFDYQANPPGPAR